MKVKTDQAVGMVILEAVLNANGNLVLPMGITVTEPLAQALLRQGIKTIEAEFADDKPKQPELTDNEFSEYVNHLFLRHRGPFMKEFQSCLLKD